MNNYGFVRQSTSRVIKKPKSINALENLFNKYNSSLGPNTQQIKQGEGYGKLSGFSNPKVDFSKFNRINTQFGTDDAKKIETAVQQNTHIDKMVNKNVRELKRELNEEFDKSAEKEELDRYEEFENSTLTAHKWCDLFLETETVHQYITPYMLDYFKIRHEELNNEKFTKGSSKEIISLQWEGLKSAIFQDWTDNKDKRISNWYVNEIDKRRKPFLRDLYKQMENFTKLLDLFGDFIPENSPSGGQAGVEQLWGLGAGEFKSGDFKDLADYKDFITNDKTFKNLIERLGREMRIDEKLIKEIVESERTNVTETEVGLMIGVKYGNKILKARPVDIALRNHEHGRPLFNYKYLEHKLLQPQHVSIHTETFMEEIKTNFNSGPFVMMIDTSGSMQGEPERIAKAMAFYLSRAAIKQGRRVFVINFSSTIECFEVNRDNFDLTKLVDFVTSGFDGGTDLSPAIKKCLELLESDDNYAKADALLISDGMFPRVGSGDIKRVELLKENDTRFIALQIGSSGNADALAMFNDTIFWGNGKEQ